MTEARFTSALGITTLLIRDTGFAVDITPAEDLTWNHGWDMACALLIIIMNVKLVELEFLPFAVNESMDGGNCQCFFFSNGLFDFSY